MTSFSEALAAGETTTEEALAIFDSLQRVETDFMRGTWQGAGFPTEHFLDGVLEACHWYGKRFDSPELVHPLLFTARSGRLIRVNPRLVMPGMRLIKYLPFLKSGWMGRIFQFCLPLFATRRSRARLRSTNYRGESSATMIYDQLPINDIFRKVDADTVLGAMDMKGSSRPFFFVLRREKQGT
ncbi:MAG: DUF4334 domain-containing protein [Desulfosudaceae bacterium]